jgi:uncharacterized membrane protein YccC
MIPAPVRAALAPSPGRWGEAIMVGAATTTALALSLVFQVPSFAAPNVAFIALQHTTVCTWHNMVRRLLIVVAAGLLLVPVGGFLVQTPWLLVPAFFVLVAALTYGVPAARNPVESVLIAFPLIGVCFSGTYDVGSLAVATRDLVAGLAIGVVVATVFARFSTRTTARVRLAGSLAAEFAGARARLEAALALWTADEPGATAPEVPVFTNLASHVQLLDLVRQEGISADADRALVTFATAAERVDGYVGTIETLARQRVGHAYRRALAVEIDRLARVLAQVLTAFEHTVRHLGTHDAADDVAAEVPWPDLADAVRTLRDRQLAAVRAGKTSAVDVTESANLNAVVQGLVGVADVLHTPPWELRDLAATERFTAPAVWPFDLFPLDRFALRYALQVALGATIALIAGFAAHVPELSTLLWNPILVAQMSYGATIRKAWLRLGGVVVGGALALATIVLVFANTGDVTVWLAVLFAVMTACQYAVLGMPVNWYGPFQVGVTYLVVLIAAAPTMDVETALWRAFGTFVGTAILFSVFRVVAPDYAGRQLVARFADLLRATLRFLPPTGEPLPPGAELIALRVASARASADILRLIEESRLEGRASGIDPRAAVEAAGVALRISLRAGITARARCTVAYPPLADDLRALLEETRAATRARIAAGLELVDARHTMAAPDTPAHHAARAAARACTGKQRADLAEPVARLAARVQRARFDDVATWPLEAASTLLAEVEHLRRMSELLPRLDDALEQMLLPGTSRDGAHAARAATELAITRP